jgi:3-oxoacyl-[acyl-carrier protein] reductase
MQTPNERHRARRHRRGRQFWDVEEYVDLDLTGRSVLVTGASRGLGRAIAGAFAAEGAHLTLSARGAGALESTAAVLRTAFPGVEVGTVPGDVTQEVDAQRMVDAAIDRFGGIDVLVNNAGASLREGDFDALWRESFAVNAVAPLRMMELAKPQLLRSPQPAVVNISSIYGRESGGTPQYNASKSAQIAMTKAYALAWARDGIRVNSVAPGAIRFDGGSWDRRVRQDPIAMERWIDENIPGGRFGRAEELAAVVVFLASPRASWVMGAILNVDGGQSRSNI